jgi:hypothetical protein
MILSVNSDFSLNSFSKVMFVMAASCVLFEIRTEFLNVIRRVSLALGGYYILSSAGLLASSQYASGRSCVRPSRHRFSWFYSVF